MSIEQLINRPCTVIRREQTEDRDGDGDRKINEVRVETVCELQQDPGFRHEGEGQLSDTRWRVFFRVGEEADSGDGVEVDGELYEILGDAWPVRDPITKRDSHVEAIARRTAGPADLPEEEGS